VMMLLVSYCENRARRMNGEGARVTLMNIEREAYRWEKDGVMTEQAAEEHVRRLEAREKRSARIARLVGITGRALTQTERGYIEKWAELPLDDAAIYTAYDRTVVNTGALKWNYMDRILTNWAAEGGMPAERRSEGGNPPQNRNRRPSSPSRDNPERAADAERLKRLREREKDPSD